MNSFGMMEKRLIVLGQQVGNRTVRNETRNICANISNKAINTIKPEILYVTADCAREEFDAVSMRKGQECRLMLVPLISIGHCWSRQALCTNMPPEPHAGS
jgi:hypothetical protein